jgi:hypothetical protein
MSAGSVPSGVTTAEIRPSAVSRPRTCASVRTSMPSPRIASATRSPMSGSTVDIGCDDFSSSVTSSPRRTIASAISTPT